MHSVYRFAEDVYSNKKNHAVQLIKLSGDDVIYEATHVAGEIIQRIDGKTNAGDLINEVASQFDKKHEAEIREKGLELFQKLLKMKLIEKV